MGGLPGMRPNCSWEFSEAMVLILRESSFLVI